MHTPREGPNNRLKHNKKILTEEHENIKPELNSI